MNDQSIENLLRKTPAPQAPADLLPRLVGDIRLPRSADGRAEGYAPRSFFRRWLPALSFSALMLASFVVIGIQASQLSELKRAMEPLRAQTQNLAALREANVAVQRLRNDNAALELLQKEKSIR